MLSPTSINDHSSQQEMSEFDKIRTNLFSLIKSRELSAI